MSDSLAKKAWVHRVLGVDIGNDARAAAAPGSIVAYHKMLLRWRDAQTQLSAILQQVSSTLLAMPEIKADPQFVEVEKAAKMLPKLVPRFGGKLEEALDAGLNATDPSEQARLRREGVFAIDAYRQQLAAASGLIRLEQFASAELGMGSKLHKALDEVLLELRQQLAA